MKTLLYTLILSLSVMTSSAQTDTIHSNDSISRMLNELKKSGIEHFTFKGIPINGSLTQFVAQLKSLNFTLLKVTEADALLAGKFAGEEVHIFVQSAQNTVYGVTVSYEEKTSWKAIKTQYENTKALLISKYGNPKESSEVFDEPIYEVPGMELSGLRKDKCNYSSTFVTENGNGMINLKISTNASLVLNYIDAMNYLLISGEIYKDY